MSLFLRAARKEEAIPASMLLADTTGEFGVAVLGLGKPELQLKAFQTWFSQHGNRFSHEHAVIAEKYGIAAGLLLSFPGAMLNALELGCGRKMFTIYGVVGALRMIWLNKSLVNNTEAEKDEYLIAHVVVDEHFRRQGIAQALLAMAEELSLAAGLHKQVLEVEIGNDNAIRLYKKAGFEIVHTVYFNDKNGRLNCPGFYKMIKQT